MRVTFFRVLRRYGFRITHRRQVLAMHGQSYPSLEAARVAVVQLVKALAQDQFTVADETGEWKENPGGPQEAQALQECQRQCQLGAKDQARFDFLAGQEALGKLTPEGAVEFKALVAKRRRLAFRDPRVRESIRASMQAAQQAGKILRQFRKLALKTQRIPPGSCA